jgi:hypothetical protein
MTNPAGRGKYSKIIRGLHEGIKAMEAVANRLLAEKDAEIASLTEERDRYRAALVVISGSPDRLQALQAVCALDNIGPPERVAE